MSNTLKFFFALQKPKKWVIADTSGKFYTSLHNILKIHDITLDKIIECVDDKSDINKKNGIILLSRLEGQKIGVNSTPTFFKWKKD